MKPCLATSTRVVFAITALVEGNHDYATGFWEAAGYTHDVSMRRYHLDLGSGL